MEDKIKLRDRIKNAWNSFFNKDPTRYPQVMYDYGQSYSYRPDRARLTRGGDRTIVNSIYNRISTDASAIDVKHVKLDKNGRYIDDMDSGLNYCLTLEANADQTGRSFMQDVILSMLDEGVVGIFPADFKDDPYDSTGWDVLTLRTAKILDWYPSHVKIEAYDERDGKKKELIWPKTMIAIVENPFYSVMNERNSTMQRLIRKLAILDAVDEQTGSNKLNMIVQLPFQVKTDLRRQQAKQRLDDIERQLTTSKYGIAYADAAEHITQLNRPLENNLMAQVEYLTSMLYSQLGITQAILDGTADEKTMLNYYNRTIEPILSAITDEMKRKFLTKTARTQGQSIEFYRDPFKLVPAEQMAELADKLTRNEIATSNEIRQMIGMHPSDDPSADELRNKNLSQPAGTEEPPVTEDGMPVPEVGEEGEMAQSDDDIVEELLSTLESQIDQIIANAGVIKEEEDE